jgi:predicted nucleic acid-binding Zn ribbon protein
VGLMKKPVLLKEILQRILKAYHLEKPLRRQRSVFLWETVVERAVKDRTKAVSFKDGKLFVEVDSSALRNELLFKKEALKRELNQRIGEAAVENIIFINRRS